MGISFDWNGWQRYQQTVPLWQWGLLIGAIGVAIWLIVRVRSYFREDADGADQSMEMLTQFRDLHQEGGLSDDEFRLIRSRLAMSAQAARVIERTDRKAKMADRDTSKSTRPLTTSRDPSITPANAKDEANSERMTEEKTD